MHHVPRGLLNATMDATRAKISPKRATRRGLLFDEATARRQQEAGTVLLIFATRRSLESGVISLKPVTEFSFSSPSWWCIKCCAPGCRTGYKSQGNVPANISLHKFPTDPALLNSWLRSIPRDDFVPSANARLCSLHFTPKDFITESVDDSRKKRPLQKRRLKNDAVPTVFPCVPSYLSRNLPPDRPTTSASVESRRAKENTMTQELIDQLHSEDCTPDLPLLRKKFEMANNKPSGFICCPNEEMDSQIISIRVHSTRSWTYFRSFRFRCFWHDFPGNSSRWASW